MSITGTTYGYDYEITPDPAGIDKFIWVLGSLDCEFTMGRASTIDEAKRKAREAAREEMEG